MWIFCCGMMRSGSTAQYNIAKRLVEYSGRGEALGFCAPNQLPSLYAAHRDPSRVYVVKCHLFIPSAMQLLARGEAHAVYIYRDLRDVVVSWMNKTGDDFRKVVGSGFVEQMLVNDLLWNSVPNLTVSVYEKMMEAMADEVRGIARCMDIELTDAEVETLAAEFGLESQRERIRAFDYAARGVHEGGHSLYNPETHLHFNHIHSGASEQWRDTLTPGQVRQLEAMVGGWLLEHGYPLSETAGEPGSAAGAALSPAHAH